MIVLEILGQLAILVALLVIGLLSKRLSYSTRAKPFYRTFYLAAALMLIGIAARLANALVFHTPPDALPQDLLWVLLYTGIPAASVTIGVLGAWRYWSWLLAERS